MNLKLSARHTVPLVSIAIFLAALLIRSRFLEFPLERDEGEYAYIGSLILQGIAPYAESYNMKMPGIYAVYALIMAAFGESIIGIKIGLTLFVCASSGFIFLIARQWLGTIGAFTAMALYSVASLLPVVQGISANSEQFLLPFALAGTWLVVAFPSMTSRVFLAGVLLGIAAIVKQHGILFSVFAGVYLLFLTDQLIFKNRLMKILLLGCGFCIPIVGTGVIMWAAGTFENFFFWTIQYALAYASQVPPVDGLKVLVLRLVTISVEAPLVMLFFALGVFVSLKRGTRQPALLAFFACSLLATVPGFYFRPHYFILLLPAICLISTVGILWSAQKLKTLYPSGDSQWTAATLVIVVLATVYFSRNLLLFAPLDQVNRIVFGANPFVESQEIAAYIHAHTSTDDRIAVLGSEPQLYFYANRRAATGYIYTYALMENQPYSKVMQEEMIEEIETSEPAMIVFVNVPNSWLVKPESDRSIFAWSAGYLEQHYNLVGQALLNPNGATIQWDKNLPEEVNLQRVGLFIYARKAVH